MIGVFLLLWWDCVVLFVGLFFLVGCCWVLLLSFMLFVHSLSLLQVACPLFFIPYRLFVVVPLVVPWQLVCFVGQLAVESTAAQGAHEEHEGAPLLLGFVSRHHWIRWNNHKKGRPWGLALI